MADCSVVVTFECWPPDTPMLCQLQADEGEVNFKIGKHSRVGVIITRRDECREQTVMHNIVSGRLIFPAAPLVLMFSVTWWGISRADLYVQDQKVGSSEDPLMRTRDFSFFASPNPNKAKDFTAQNDSVRMRRANKLEHWLRPKVGSRPGGKEHLLDALREEVEQIEILLLALVRDKRLSSVRTLAGKLRILLCRDGQTPLLLACAAIKKVDLTVYVNGNPEEQPSLGAKGLGVAASSVQTTPDIFLQTPVDLELWLDFEALRLNGREVSNHELIKDLGNSIGNHLDPNIRLSVSTLRGWRFGSDKEDAVKRYVQRLSEIVVFLAKRL